MAKQAQTKKAENIVFSLFAVEGTLSKEIFTRQFTPEQWEQEYKKTGTLVRTVNRITKMVVYSDIKTFRIVLNDKKRDFKAGRFAIELRKLSENALEAYSPGISASPKTFKELVKISTDKLTESNGVELFDNIELAEKSLKSNPNSFKLLSEYGGKVMKQISNDA